jgi:hypothetical protein
MAQTETRPTEESTMGTSPHPFESITHFSISDVKKDPISDCIATLTVDFESKTRGKHSLVLIRPWPPYGRPGRELTRLRSLSNQDIDLTLYAWLADKQDPKGARIEIFLHDSESFTVPCGGIEGLPSRVESAQQP